MSDLPVALQTALAEDNPLIFGAIRIDLPSATLRLLDGAAELTIDGDLYAGEDATFGTLAAIDALDDGMGDEAPALSLTLHPASDAAAANLSAATMQGSRVRLWIGAVTRSTGAVIDKYLLFDGEIDVPILSADKSTRDLEYECVSAFERLFDMDEGNRLSDAFHKSVWTGEEGLEHMTGLPKTIYWGVTPPRGGGTFGGSYGGGFGTGSVRDGFRMDRF